MNSLMYYTNHKTNIMPLAINNNLIIRIVPFLLLFLTSCTQLQTQSSNQIDPKNADQQVSYEDLDNYKAALNALRKNNLDSAESLLIDFTENQPELAGAWANLGLIYYKRNKFIKSKEYVSKAINLNSKNAYAQNLLGMIENKNGEFRKAETHFKLAIKSKKDYAYAHYNIALLYDIYFHEIKKSISHYKKYLKLLTKKGLKDKQTVDWVEQLENSLKKG